MGHDQWISQINEKKGNQFYRICKNLCTQIKANVSAEYKGAKRRKKKEEAREKSMTILYNKYSRFAQATDLKRFPDLCFGEEET